jgi:type I restriction enzyme M protein
MARKAGGKETKTLEQRLWDAADALRGNQEPSEYKHVVLGLVFLKYISDRFETRYREIESALSDPGSDEYIPNETRRQRFLEDRDEYRSNNVFWVPTEARWSHIQDRAKLPEIGQVIDNAMDLIEKENPSIKGVLPRNYGREGLDKGRLGQLVDLIGSIGFTETDDHGSDDVLGHVYEYFLGQFAGKETGKDAGAFYTPRSVVKTLVEMLEPFHGRVYDPACGSGGMFVQSAEFVKAHGGKRTDISVYGQEFTDTTWKLAKMNLALRGIEADLGDRSADSFTQNLHPELRADFVIANPPFNVSNWWNAKLQDDRRWKYGTPPEGNANFAWVQHFIYHLGPKGTAGFVLANGSLSSKTNGEGEIRRRLIEDGVVDCIVAMPDKLFFNTGISVSLWFVSKDRHGNGHRRRNTEILFIDARRLGTMESRRLRVFTDDDIAKIAGPYHAWRNHDGDYTDIPGFCKAAPLDDVINNDFVLTPGRYVGAEEAEADDELVAEKIERLTAELFEELDRGLGQRLVAVRAPTLNRALALRSSEARTSSTEILTEADWPISATSKRMGSVASLFSATTYCSTSLVMAPRSPGRASSPKTCVPRVSISTSR